jgi:hypothetical protein
MEYLTKRTYSSKAKKVDAQNASLQAIHFPSATMDVSFPLQK